MSEIESNIIDPGKSPPPAPGAPVPVVDPDGDIVGSDDIREPGTDRPAIEPDPEEGRHDLPNIRHA